MSNSTDWSGTAQAPEVDSIYTGLLPEYREKYFCRDFVFQFGSIILVSPCELN